VIHISSPNPLKRPEGMSLEAFRDAGVQELEDKILELGPDNVAAHIAEPVLASGGVIVPVPGYQKMCLDVCHKYDVVYISDEVVTAFGRLGQFNEDGSSLELDYQMGDRIDEHYQELGLMVRPLFNMCVMSPPLIISIEQIDDMVGMLREGITRAMHDL
jgi:adenosylmethionine-8-amino-7-oxononanoate aminotransferase